MELINGTIQREQNEKNKEQIKQMNDSMKNLKNLMKDVDCDLLATDDNLWTWEKEKGVKLRAGDRTTPSVSVVTAFLRTVEKYGDRLALATKIEGKWKTWTYTDYYGDVLKAAKSLIAIGLNEYEGVGIIGFNSPEWFIADLATIFAVGLATGIYTTNSADACQFVLDSAGCSVVIVENDYQLQKILKIRSQLKRSLKAIVQYKGKLKTDALHQDVYTWEAFLKLGEKTSTEELKNRMKRNRPNKCCTLIYTSGTTGNPKGAMLSHDNLTWTPWNAGRLLGVREGSEVIVSFLPLSHVAAQILDIYLPLRFGLSVYFAQPDALKGSLGDTLREVRPTVFLGVPRVWEKMEEKMTEVFKKSGRVKRSLLQWSRQVGLKGNEAKINGDDRVMPTGWSLASLLVFRKIKKVLGFDRCHLFFSAAAPIMKETLEFFTSLDITILEVFGMSESSGPHTLSLLSKRRMTSAGKGNEGNLVFILNPDENGNGEICMDGRNVFMGYLNEEEKTREVFTLDDRCLLLSGDIGRLDEDGFLYITGRIKELIITAGGENVAPVPIEDTVKEFLPCLSNCMLVGDKRKFLSLLVTLKMETDPETAESTDLLSPSVVEWCKSFGSAVTSLSHILSRKSGDPVLNAIQDGIDRTNERAVSSAQRIQKWLILPRDFSIAGGELGPTLKLKRHVVTQIYSSTIDSLYDERENT